ncbi:hypothetical protein FE257_005968, partial [Aspergillus nanangensis]
MFGPTPGSFPPCQRSPRARAPCVRDPNGRPFRLPPLKGGSPGAPTCPPTGELVNCPRQLVNLPTHWSTVHPLVNWSTCPPTGQLVNLPTPTGQPAHPLVNCPRPPGQLVILPTHWSTGQPAHANWSTCPPTGQLSTPTWPSPARQLASPL